MSATSYQKQWSYRYDMIRIFLEERKHFEGASQWSLRYCYWSWAAWQRTVTERIYRVHLPRRECQWNAFNDQVWTDPRRKKSQNRTGSPCSSQCMEENPCDSRKPRIVPYKNTWKLNQNTEIGAIWNSLKRKECSVIKHDHTQSFSTTHPSCLHRESGMHEDEACELTKRYAWLR